MRALAKSHSYPETATLAFVTAVAPALAVPRLRVSWKTGYPANREKNSEILRFQPFLTKICPKNTVNPVTYE